MQQNEYVLVSMGKKCIKLKGTLTNSALFKNRERYPPQSFLKNLFYLAESVAAQEPVLLMGPTSCKTLLVETWADITNVRTDMKTIHLTSETETSDLVGQIVPFTVSQALFYLVKIIKEFLQRTRCVAENMQLGTRSEQVSQTITTIHSLLHDAEALIVQREGKKNKKLAQSDQAIGKGLEEMNYKDQLEPGLIEAEVSEPYVPERTFVLPRSLSSLVASTLSSSLSSTSLSSASSSTSSVSSHLSSAPGTDDSDEGLHLEESDIEIDTSHSTISSDELDDCKGSLMNDNQSDDSSAEEDQEVLARERLALESVAAAVREARAIEQSGSTAVQHEEDAAFWKGVTSKLRDILPRLTKLLSCVDSDVGLELMLVKITNVLNELPDTAADEGSTHFVFSDGALTQAAKLGTPVLLEDFDLPRQSVTERLNSAMEAERTFALSEDVTCQAHEKGSTQFALLPGFQIFATVNSDARHHSLSSASRSRFTEIWVDEYSEEDMWAIVRTIILDIDLLDQDLKREMLARMQSIKSDQILEVFNLCPADEKVYSIRQIIKWVKFVRQHLQQCPEGPSVTKEVLQKWILLGAKHIFFDRLPSAERYHAMQKFSRGFIPVVVDLVSAKAITEAEQSDNIFTVVGKRVRLSYMGVAVPLNIGAHAVTNSQLEMTHTVIDNASRIFSSLLTGEPLLLEGPPGCGKTALVCDIANMLGFQVERINFSATTTIDDLIGRHAPTLVDGQRRCVWQEGSLLKALKDGSGKWILLDEINLASPEVLEALWQLFDVSQTHFLIPSMPLDPERPDGILIRLKASDRAGLVRSSVSVFGTMNPQSVGGNRNKLPKSVLNRFTKVRLDGYSREETQFVAAKMFSEAVHDKLIDKVHLLQILKVHEVMADLALQKKIAKEGEHFNLRDLAKLHAVIQGNSRAQSAYLSRRAMDTSTISAEQQSPDFRMIGLRRFLMLVYGQGLQNSGDRELVATKINEICPISKDLQRFEEHYAVSTELWIPDFVRIGCIYLEKLMLKKQSRVNPLVHTPETLQQLEMLAAATQSRRAILLEGLTCSKKTALVQELAMLCNRNLVVISMHQDIETSDLIGQFLPVGGDSTLCKVKALSSEFDEFVDETTRYAVVYILPTVLSLHGQSHEHVFQLLQKTAQIVERNLDVDAQISDLYVLETRVSDLFGQVGFVEQIFEHLMQVPDLRLVHEGMILDTQSKAKIFAEEIGKLKKGASAQSGFEFIPSRFVLSIMKGDWVLLDNINSAPPEVVERLNSLVEERPVLNLFDAADHSRLGGATELSFENHNMSPEFRLFATSNIGRRHSNMLSSAFLNRVLTIWLPSMDSELEYAVQLKVDAGRVESVLRELNKMKGDGVVAGVEIQNNTSVHVSGDISSRKLISKLKSATNDVCMQVITPDAEIILASSLSGIPFGRCILEVIVSLHRTCKFLHTSHAIKLMSGYGPTFRSAWQAARQTYSLVRGGYSPIRSVSVAVIQSYVMLVPDKKQRNMLLTALSSNLKDIKAAKETWNALEPPCSSDITTYQHQKKLIMNRACILQGALVLIMCECGLGVCSKDKGSGASERATFLILQMLRLVNLRLVNDEEDIASIVQKVKAGLPGECAVQARDLKRHFEAFTDQVHQIIESVSFLDAEDCHTMFCMILEQLNLLQTFLLDDIWTSFAVNKAIIDAKKQLKSLQIILHKLKWLERLFYRPTSNTLPSVVSFYMTFCQRLTANIRSSRSGKDGVIFAGAELQVSMMEPIMLGSQLRDNAIEYLIENLEPEDVRNLAKLSVLLDFTSFKWCANHAFPDMLIACPVADEQYNGLVRMESLSDVSTAIHGMMTVLVPICNQTILHQAKVLQNAFGKASKELEKAQEEVNKCKAQLRKTEKQIKTVEKSTTRQHKTESQLQTQTATLERLEKAMKDKSSQTSQNYSAWENEVKRLLRTISEAHNALQGVLLSPAVKHLMQAYAMQSAERHSKVIETCKFEGITSWESVLQTEDFCTALLALSEDELSSSHWSDLWIALLQTLSDLGASKVSRLRFVSVETCAEKIYTKAERLLASTDEFLVFIQVSVRAQEQRIIIFDCARSRAGERNKLKAILFDAPGSFEELDNSIFSMCSSCEVGKVEITQPEGMKLVSLQSVAVLYNLYPRLCKGKLPKHLVLDGHTYSQLENKVATLRKRLVAEQQAHAKAKKDQKVVHAQAVSSCHFHQFGISRCENVLTQLSSIDDLSRSHDEANLESISKSMQCLVDQLDKLHRLSLNANSRDKINSEYSAIHEQLFGGERSDLEKARLFKTLEGYVERLEKYKSLRVAKSVLSQHSDACAHMKRFAALDDLLDNLHAVTDHLMCIFYARCDNTSMSSESMKGSRATAEDMVALLGDIQPIISRILKSKDMQVEDVHIRTLLETVNRFDAHLDATYDSMLTSTHERKYVVSNMESRFKDAFLHSTAAVASSDAEGSAISLAKNEPPSLAELHLSAVSEAKKTATARLKEMQMEMRRLVGVPYTIQVAIIQALDKMEQLSDEEAMLLDDDAIKKLAALPHQLSRQLAKWKSKMQAASIAPALAMEQDHVKPPPVSAWSNFNSVAMESTDAAIQHEKLSSIVDWCHSKISNNVIDADLHEGVCKILHNSIKLCALQRLHNEVSLGKSLSPQDQHAVCNLLQILGLNQAAVELQLFGFDEWRASFQLAEMLIVETNKLAAESRYYVSFDQCRRFLCSPHAIFLGGGSAESLEDEAFIDLDVVYHLCITLDQLSLKFKEVMHAYTHPSEFAMLQDRENIMVDSRVQDLDNVMFYAPFCLPVFIMPQVLDPYSATMLCFPEVVHPSAGARFSALDVNKDMTLDRSKSCQLLNACKAIKADDPAIEQFCAGGKCLLDNYAEFRRTGVEILCDEIDNRDDVGLSFCGLVNSVICSMQLLELSHRLWCKIQLEVDITHTRVAYERPNCNEIAQQQLQLEDVYNKDIRGVESELKELCQKENDLKAQAKEEARNKEALRNSTDNFSFHTAHNRREDVERQLQDIKNQIAEKTAARNQLENAYQERRNSLSIRMEEEQATIEAKSRQVCDEVKDRISSFWDCLQGAYFLRQLMCERDNDGTVKCLDEFAFSLSCGMQENFRDEMVRKISNSLISERLYALPDCLTSAVTRVDIEISSMLQKADYFWVSIQRDICEDDPFCGVVSKGLEWMKTSLIMFRRGITDIAKQRVRLPHEGLISMDLIKLFHDQCFSLLFEIDTKCEKDDVLQHKLEDTGGVTGICQKLLGKLATSGEDYGTAYRIVVEEAARFGFTLCQVTVGLVVIRRPHLQARFKDLIVHLETMLQQPLVLNQHQLEDQQQALKMQLQAHSTALSEWSEAVRHGYVTNPFAVCSMYESVRQTLSKIFLKPSRSYIYVLRHLHALLSGMVKDGCPTAEVVDLANSVKDACLGISEQLIGAIPSFSEEEPYAIISPCIVDIVLDEQTGADSLFEKCRTLVTYFEDTFKSAELNPLLAGFQHAMVRLVDDLLQVVVQSLVSDWQHHLKTLRQSDTMAKLSVDDVKLYMVESEIELSMYVSQFTQHAQDLVFAHKIAALLTVGMEKISTILLSKDNFTGDEQERLSRSRMLILDLNAHIEDGKSVLQMPVREVVASCCTTSESSGLPRDLVSYVLSAENEADAQVIKIAQSKALQLYDQLQRQLGVQGYEEPHMSIRTAARKVVDAHKQCDVAIKNILQDRSEQVKRSWFNVKERYESQKQVVEKRNQDKMKDFNQQREEFRRLDNEKVQVVKDCVESISEGLALLDDGIVLGTYSKQRLCEMFQNLRFMAPDETQQKAAIHGLTTEVEGISEIEIKFETIVIDKADYAAQLDSVSLALLLTFQGAYIPGISSNTISIEMQRQPDGSPRAWRTNVTSLRFVVHDSAAFGLQLDIKISHISQDANFLKSAWGRAKEWWHKPKTILFTLSRTDYTYDMFNRDILWSSVPGKSSKIRLLIYPFTKVRLSGVTSLSDIVSRSASIHAQCLIFKTLFSELQASLGDEHDFKCSICHLDFLEPVVTLCRHTMCKHCAEECIKKKPECPLCRTELSDGDYQPAGEGVQIRIFQFVCLNGGHAWREYRNRAISAFASKGLPSSPSIRLKIEYESDSETFPAEVDAENKLARVTVPARFYGYEVSYEWHVMGHPLGASRTRTITLSARERKELSEAVCNKLLIAATTLERELPFLIDQWSQVPPYVKNNQPPKLEAAPEFEDSIDVNGACRADVLCMQSSPQFASLNALVDILKRVGFKDVMPASTNRFHNDGDTFAPLVISLAQSMKQEIEQPIWDMNHVSDLQQAVKVTTKILQAEHECLKCANQYLDHKNKCRLHSYPFHCRMARIKENSYCITGANIGIRADLVSTEQLIVSYIDLQKPAVLLTNCVRNAVYDLVELVFRGVEIMCVTFKDHKQCQAVRKMLLQLRTTIDGLVHVCNSELLKERGMQLQYCLSLKVKAFDYRERRLMDVIERCQDIQDWEESSDISSKMCKAVMDCLLLLPSHFIYVTNRDGTLICETDKLTLDFGHHLVFSSAVVMDVQIVNQTAQDLHFCFDYESCKVMRVHIADGGIAPNSTGTLRIEFNPQLAAASISSFVNICECAPLSISQARDDTDHALVVNLEMVAKVEEPIIHISSLSTVSMDVERAHALSFGTVGPARDGVVNGGVQEHTQSFTVRNCTSCPLVVKLQILNGQDDECGVFHFPSDNTSGSHKPKGFKALAPDFLVGCLIPPMTSIPVKVTFVAPKLPHSQEALECFSAKICAYCGSASSVYQVPLHARVERGSCRITYEGEALEELDGKIVLEPTQTGLPIHRQLLVENTGRVPVSVTIRCMRNFPQLDVKSPLFMQIAPGESSCIWLSCPAADDRDIKEKYEIRIPEVSAECIRLEVCCKTGKPQYTHTPNSLSFGSATTEAYLTMTNKGKFPLQVWFRNTMPDLLQLDPEELIVEASASCKVQCFFKPAAVDPGDVSGEIIAFTNIYKTAGHSSNGFGELQRFTIPVTRTSAIPLIEVSTSQCLHLGYLHVGTSVQKSFRLKRKAESDSEVTIMHEGTAVRGGKILVSVGLKQGSREFKGGEAHKVKLKANEASSKEEFVLNVQADGEASGPFVYQILFTPADGESCTLLLSGTVCMELTTQPSVDSQVRIEKLIESMRGMFPTPNVQHAATSQASSPSWINLPSECVSILAVVDIYVRARWICAEKLKDLEKQPCMNDMYASIVRLVVDSRLSPLRQEYEDNSVRATLDVLSTIGTKDSNLLLSILTKCKDQYEHLYTSSPPDLCQQLTSLVSYTLFVSLSPDKCKSLPRVQYLPVCALLQTLHSDRLDIGAMAMLGLLGFKASRCTASDLLTRLPRFVNESHDETLTQILGIIVPCVPAFAFCCTRFVSILQAEGPKDLCLALSESFKCCKSEAATFFGRCLPLCECDGTPWRRQEIISFLKGRGVDLELQGLLALNVIASAGSSLDDKDSVVACNFMVFMMSMHVQGSLGEDADHNALTRFRGFIEAVMKVMDISACCTSDWLAEGTSLIGLLIPPEKSEGFRNACVCLRQSIARRSKDVQDVCKAAASVVKLSAHGQALARLLLVCKDIQSARESDDKTVRIVKAVFEYIRGSIKHKFFISVLVSLEASLCRIMLRRADERFMQDCEQMLNELQQLDALKSFTSESTWTLQPNAANRAAHCLYDLCSQARKRNVVQACEALVQCCVHLFNPASFKSEAGAATSPCDADYHRIKKVPSHLELVSKILPQGALTCDGKTLCTVCEQTAMLEACIAWNPNKHERRQDLQVIRETLLKGTSDPLSEPGMMLLSIAMAEICGGHARDAMAHTYALCSRLVSSPRECDGLQLCCVEMFRHVQVYLLPGQPAADTSMFTEFIDKIASEERAMGDYENMILSRFLTSCKTSKSLQLLATLLIAIKPMASLTFENIGNLAKIYFANNDVDKGCNGHTIWTLALGAIEAYKGLWHSDDKAEALDAFEVTCMHMFDGQIAPGAESVHFSEAMHLVILAIRLKVWTEDDMCGIQARLSCMMLCCKLTIAAHAKPEHQTMLGPDEPPAFVAMLQAIKSAPDFETLTRSQERLGLARMMLKKEEVIPWFRWEKAQHVSEWQGSWVPVEQEHVLLVSKESSSMSPSQLQDRTVIMSVELAFATADDVLPDSEQVKNILVERLTSYALKGIQFANRQVTSFSITSSSASDSDEVDGAHDEDDVDFDHDDDDDEDIDFEDELEAADVGTPAKGVAASSSKEADVLHIARIEVMVECEQLMHAVKLEQHIHKLPSARTLPPCDSPRITVIRLMKVEANHWMSNQFDKVKEYLQECCKLVDRVGLRGLMLFEPSVSLEVPIDRLVNSLCTLNDAASNLMLMFGTLGDILKKTHPDARLEVAYTHCRIEDIILCSFKVINGLVAFKWRLGTDPIRRVLITDVEDSLKGLAKVFGVLKPASWHNDSVRGLFKAAGFFGSKASGRSVEAEGLDFEVPDIMPALDVQQLRHEGHFEDSKSNKLERYKVVKSILHSNTLADLIKIMDNAEIMAMTTAEGQASDAAPSSNNQDVSLTAPAAARRDTVEVSYSDNYIAADEEPTGGAARAIEPPTPRGVPAPRQRQTGLTVIERVKLQLPAKSIEGDAGPETHRGRSVNMKYGLEEAKRMKEMLQGMQYKDLHKNFSHVPVGEVGEWQDVAFGDPIKLDPDRVTYGLLVKFTRELREVLVTRIRRGFTKLMDCNEARHTFEFCFLIDHSGSMDGTKIQHALEALVLLLETLRRLECRFAVVRFGGETTQRCLKSMQDEMTLETGQRIIEMCLSPDEGTYPASAVRFVVKPENSSLLGWSAPKENVHQFIIMITDGITIQSKEKDYVCGDKKLCIIQIGDPDTGTEQQAAHSLEKIAGKGNTKLVSNEQLTDLHEILANLILQQFARVFNTSDTAAKKVSTLEDLAPLKMVKSEGLTAASAATSDVDLSILKEQGFSLVECSTASAQVPWLDKIKIEKHRPVDTEGIKALKCRLSEAHLPAKLQSMAKEVEQANKIWREWEKKLRVAIANVQASLEQTALRVNRYTRMKAATSGSCIDIRGIIKYIITDGQYKKLYKSKKAGGMRDYRIALVMDMSASMKGPQGAAAIEGLISLVAALERMRMTNFSVATFGDQVRVLKADDSPWDGASKHALLSCMTQNRMSEVATLDADGVHHAVDLLCSAKGSGPMICFVFTDGYGSRGIRLSSELMRANALGVMVVGVSMGVDDSFVSTSYQHWINAVNAASLGDGLAILFKGDGMGSTRDTHTKRAFRCLMEGEEDLVSNPDALNKIWSSHESYYEDVKHRLAQDRSLHLNTRTLRGGANGRASVDVCFVMDCTGSMASWIDACKNKALEIATTVKNMVEKQGKESTVNMAFVAYRDWSSKGVYDPPGYVDVCPFTTDIAQLQAFVGSQRASGGGDGPEDICGGFKKCAELNWTSQAKYLFLIADCPCHGKSYHDMDDSFPAGDPQGMIPEKQLEDMMRPEGKYGTRCINVTFVRATKHTDKMVRVWNEHLQTALNKQIKTLDLSSESSDLAADFGSKIKDEIVQDWMMHHM